MYAPKVSVTLTDDQWAELERLLRLSHRRDMREIADVIRLRQHEPRLYSVDWHESVHRSVMASVALGAWMSAALDDPAVCDAMKADIQEWFSAGDPVQTLAEALAHYAP